MPNPEYDGLDMGPFCTVIPTANPAELQINTYPGVNGLEVINHGSRGGRSTARGVCYADTPALLAVVEQDFRAKVAAGTSGTLIDTAGIEWDGVIMTAFEPFGEILFISGWGWARAFSATFLHTF